MSERSERFEVHEALQRAMSKRVHPSLPVDMIGRSDQQTLVQAINYALAHTVNYLTAVLEDVLKDYDGWRRQQGEQQR